MKKKIVPIVLLPFLVMVTLSSMAEEITEVSRYTTVKNKATRAQINPLLMVVQTHFPQSVQTVGEAMAYVLQYSGYSLVDKNLMDANVRQMLSQTLPMIDRNLGPVTLQEALEVLAGKHVFRLTQDPLHRKVSFEVLPGIQQQYEDLSLSSESE